MVGRPADVTRIGAVVFQKVHAGLFKEGVEFAEIILAPVTSDAGRVAKNSTGFSCLRIHDVVSRPDASARQEGVSAQFYLFAMGVIGQLLELSEVGGVFIFHVE